MSRLWLALAAACGAAFSPPPRVRLSGAPPPRRGTPDDWAAEADATIAALEREHWESLSAAERKILAKSRAGDAYLRLGQFDDALAAFDEAQALSGGGRYEWHRGVALYYLGREADALADFGANAARFEARFESPATEERLWGAAAAARAGLAPPPPSAEPDLRESRPVLRAATRLFDGDEAAGLDALRTLCDQSDGDDKLQRALYGHFYAGLFRDAAGDAESAAAHLALAADRAGAGDDFAAALPALHAAARGWALADVSPAARDRAARFEAA